MAFFDTRTIKQLIFYFSLLGTALGVTEKHRLVWSDDPSTTVTVGWDQVSGSGETVHYGTDDLGTDATAYPFSRTVDRSVSYYGMDNRFVRLSGLSPDTAYFFVIADSEGVSERFWFRTAPDTPRPFSFIAGGDSRNNAVPRQRANRLVAKLRPLFVAFTGDMIDDDVPSEWQEWLDDWELTTTADGRMIPVLPHLGNHENQGSGGGETTLHSLFDINQQNYYALSFGGNLLRYYVLNSETSAGGSQKTWLTADLAGPGATHTHLAAGYHKPMRPHQSGKSEGSDEYNNWAQLFFDHGMDLVCESDSHTMKRTYPLEPSTEAGHDEGFIRNDAAGTVYIGEGCWGAPLRQADDNKSWTEASGMFNGFDLIYVYADRMENITVNIDCEPFTGALTETEGMALPEGLEVWRPASGPVNIVNQTVPEIRQSHVAWLLETFTGAIPPKTGLFEDYDGDGAANVVERVLGSEPLEAGKPADLKLRIGSGGVVVVEYTTDPGVEGSVSLEGAAGMSGFTSLEEGIDYLLTSETLGELMLNSAEIIGDLGAGTGIFRLRVRP